MAALKIVAKTITKITGEWVDCIIFKDEESITGEYIVINTGVDNIKTICLPTGGFNVEPLEHKYWIHTKTGNTYTVISNNVESYLNGNWIPSIIYENKFGVMFVRRVDDFFNNFKIKEQE